MKERRGILKSIFIAPIRFYRRFISPAKPPCCKYAPTCSQYAITAIEEWGAVAGGALAAFRLLRCNPFSRGGYDPVPLRRKKSGDGMNKRYKKIKAHGNQDKTNEEKAK